MAEVAAPARTRAEWCAALRTWPVMVVTPFVVLGCALLTGVVVWDLKLPASPVAARPNPLNDGSLALARA